MAENMKVNGKTITATRFAFDGCHKIYLLENADQEAHAKEIGYDILPISELKDAYDSSCSLKFISNWGLETNEWVSYVEQFEKAKFTGFRKGRRNELAA